MRTLQLLAFLVACVFATVVSAVVSTPYKTTCFGKPKQDKYAKTAQCHVVDRFNRTRIWHGLNLVYKVEPFVPSDIDSHSVQWSPTSLSSHELDLIAEMGINKVRLGVMWPGVQPTSAAVNTTYLNEIEKIVNALGKRGIDTILDMHQDLLTEYHCGEGIPKWIVERVMKTWKNGTVEGFPAPIAEPFNDNHDPFYMPSVEECLSSGEPFGKLYMTRAQNRLWQDLYDNTAGIQDFLILFWKAVDRRFHQNPYVLGYELINEPWVGNLYSNWRRVLYTGFADVNNIAPMYNRICKGLKKSNKFVFLEPNVVDPFQVGWKTMPCQNSNPVLSFHIYCPVQGADGAPSSKFFCNMFDPNMVSKRVKDANRLGVPSMLTEYGSVTENRNGLDEIDHVSTLAESHLVGMDYWEFKDYADPTSTGPGGRIGVINAKGDVERKKVLHLARPYAQAIAGRPLESKFDEKRKIYTLVFQTLTEVNDRTQPTIVYVNPAWSTKKMQVDVSPSTFTVKHDRDRYLRIHAPKKGVPAGTTVAVRVHFPQEVSQE